MKRFTVAGIFFLALLAATPSMASPFVVGSPAQSHYGNCFPFGCDYEAGYQQVYTHGLFTGPITITGLEFYNTAYDSGATGMNSGTWTISLSTTSADWNTLAGSYNANVGADNTEVFSGSIDQPWAFGNTLTIPFSTSFTYDPADGNLLLTVFGTGVADGHGEIFFDVNPSNNGMGRVFKGTGVQAQSGFGLVTGFETGMTADFRTVAPVPEPASLILLGTGLSGLAVRNWRKRRA